jgi:hypothetical protein
MRKIINLLLISTTISTYFFACQSVDNKEKDIQTLKSDVYYLADDALEGREIGTAGELKAAEYLAGRFKDLGLEPKGTDGYYQEFSFTPMANPHMAAKDDDTLKVYGRNVVGYIDNNSENTVIIGAHFDHLGFGEEGSLHRGDKQIHNGADDNASGVAAMLLLAEKLKKRKSDNNYLFIAFSGEEKGLYGSNYYSKNPTIDMGKANYMINMDMVGRLNDEHSLAINGIGTSPTWSSVIENIGIDSLKIITSESGVGPSDHTSFYLQDMPVLHFFTGQHEDYHKPSDDADLINYEGMYAVVAFIDSIITKVEGDGKLAFTKTKDDSDNAPRFTVTLGVVPDYMFDGEGMRIDGVSEDKPAQKAGLLKGDVVVQLGDSVVTDMMSYMRALSQFKKGDATEVVVKRGDEEMKYPVQF